MSFIVRKNVATPIIIDDLGLTITGIVGTERDLRDVEPMDIVESADLAFVIASGDLIVLDPRDDLTVLTISNGELARANANDTHYGINGGRFGALDDPTFIPANNFLVEFDSGSAQMVQIDPSAVISSNSSAISNIVAGMFVDGADSTVSYSPTSTILTAGQDETSYDAVAPNGAFVGGDGVGGTAYVPGDTITMSDGSVITVDAVDGNGDVTDFTVTTSGGTNVIPGVPLTQTSTSGTGTAFTVTPEANNISDGTISIEVNDSYLRNNGDTLDSGTLTITAGAAINIAAGGDLTIQDAPVLGTDAANKDYVDSVAAGLDPKESVRYCSVTDIAGTFTSGGGTGGTGEFTGVDLTDAAIFDGLTLGAIIIGDRLLIKAEGTNTQNGIYVVTTAGVAGVIERAPDQDGSVAAEVSGGNFTFVEGGTTCAGTGWVLTGDGILTLNTDPMLWTQFSESSTLTDGLGISTGGNNLDLDLADTLGTGNVIVSADLLAFHDQDGTPAASGSGSQTYARTFANMLDDLNIVNGVAGTGILVQTAPNTYAARSLAVAGLGALDGLVLANADGVAGNPTFGLDIQNLPVQTAIDPTLDRVAVWDSSANANVYYTVSDIATSLSSVNSFEVWAAAGNTTGGASIIAASGTDTATITGGIGINIDVNAGTDTLTYSITQAGMADTAVVGADTVMFFDASNANEPEFRSFTDLIADMGIATNIAASTDEDFLGINVTGSDIGLDIDGLTDNAADMDALDEFPLHDKSEGTLGANRKITGQNIADGVVNILNIDGLTISTINAQPILTITDTTRGNKQLSSDSSVFNFGENALSHLDWIRVGNASDADSGHIMPMQGTVVMITAHCENTGANSKDIHLFIDGVDQGSLGTLSGGAEAEITNTTVDIDFTQGQKIRLRALDSGSGNIQDTVANVFVRWRA